MLAAIRHSYGPPSSIKIMEVPDPVPGDREILVRVHATTVSRTDCGILSGQPYVLRFFTGLRSPRNPITGSDFAGIVVGCGRQVMKFKEGDRIWGFHDEGLGSHAQYLSIAETANVAPIPDALSFAQAAACAEGAHYAINFINKVKIKPGDPVLVLGATGAIGSAAVQLLKTAGTIVTATCRGQHKEMVRLLGAETILDYELEDIRALKQRFPFIFDSVGKSTFGYCKPLLTPKGVYISSELGPAWENTWKSLLTPLTGGKRIKFPLPVNIRRSMEIAGSLAEGGKFIPMIDRRYPLQQIREAFEYTLSGQKAGNVILTVHPDPE